MPAHANDNGLISANSFTDLAARRATAALPLALRLARAGRHEDLGRLIRHGAVTVMPS
ncbi:hypothetical protein ABIA00_006107 [Bradyrhizobium ottawaense]